MGRIENEIGHFRKIAANAEEIWGWSTPVGKLRAQRRAHYLIQLGRLNDAEFILEIGCGSGLFTERVHQNSRATIIALDLCEDLLAIAKKKGLNRAAFQAADCHKLEFDNEHFDRVFGNSILHHLDMEEALKEIFRVLKKGGRTIFAEPNMLNPQIFIQKNVPWFKKYVGDSPDERAVVRWKVAKMMKKIGFKRVTHFPFDFLHPLTPPILIGLVKKVGAIAEKIPVLKEIAGSVIICGEK